MTETQAAIGIALMVGIWVLSVIGAHVYAALMARRGERRGR